jgi:Protein of unknown function (DUF3040)
MGLPAGQVRVLGSIEARLTAADPHLASMFAIFGRLNVGEPVSAERLVSRPGLRPPRSPLAACVMVLIPVMFLAIVVVSALAGGRLSPRACEEAYPVGASSPQLRPACQLSANTTAVKSAPVTTATPAGAENPACIAPVQHGRSARGWVCYK